MCFELAKTNKRGAIAIAGAAAVGVGALALIVKVLNQLLLNIKQKQ